MSEKELMEFNTPENVMRSGNEEYRQERLRLFKEVNKDALTQNGTDFH